MATTLGTKLGTMLGTELADMADPGTPVVPSTIAGLLPRHRYRASQAATSGGNVVNLPNEGTAGGTLDVVTGTLAAPTADPAFANALSVAFTGSQEMRGSFAPSGYKFLNDGSPFTVYMVGLAAQAQALIATTFAAVPPALGFRTGIAQSNTSITLTDGINAPTPATIVVTGATAGVGTCTRSDLAGGAVTHSRNGALVAGPTALSAPLANSDPSYAFTIGRIPNGGTFSNGSRLAEFIAFDRALTAPEMAVVDAELLATYGPWGRTAFRGLFREDAGGKDSWFDASNTLLSGGRVTSFVDVVDPTHELAQASSGNQVFTPTADASMAGALSATFVAANSNFYASNRAASAWRYLHNGTGQTTILVLVPSNLTGVQYFAGTNNDATNSAGFDIIRNTNQYLSRAFRAAGGNVYSVTTGLVFTANVATFVGASLTSANYAVRVKSTTPSSGAPSTVDNTDGLPMHLGARRGAGLFADMRFRALYSWRRVLTAPELAIVYAHIQADTGITP